MNRDEFLDLLSRFARRALPARVGRHVYLWHGDLQELTAAVPGMGARILDLHEVAARQPRAPRSVDAARRLLDRAVRAQLDELVPSPGQQVIVVTGCDLLSRYRVRLTPFFERASERVMIAFAVSPDESHFEPVTPLPDYVSLEPDAPLEYLLNGIDRRAVINV